MNSILREEQKAAQTIRDAAKAGDASVCRVLAKEVVSARAAVKRLKLAKTHLSSVELQIRQQQSQLRVAGSLQESAQVMSSMQRLVRTPELQKAMTDMQREMFKAGVITEAFEEALDDAMEPDEDEMDDDTIKAEVAKVLAELTSGEAGGLLLEEEEGLEEDLDKLELEEDAKEPKLAVKKKEKVAEAPLQVAEAEADLQQQHRRKSKKKSKHKERELETEAPTSSRHAQSLDSGTRPKEQLPMTNRHAHSLDLEEYPTLEKHHHHHHHKRKSKSSRRKDVERKASSTADSGISEATTASSSVTMSEDSEQRRRERTERKARRAAEAKATKEGEEDEDRRRERREERRRRERLKEIPEDAAPAPALEDKEGERKKTRREEKKSREKTHGGFDANQEGTEKKRDRERKKKVMTAELA